MRALRTYAAVAAVIIGLCGVASAQPAGSDAGSSAAPVPAAAGSGAGSGSAAPKKPSVVEIDCAKVPADALTLTTANGAFDPPVLVVPTGNAIRVKLTTDDVQPYPATKDHPSEAALVAPANKTTCLRFDNSGEFKYHSGSKPIEGLIIAKPWYDILADKQVEQSGNFWMPQSVNIEADESDFMFYSVLGLSLFFFVAIAVAVIYLVVKYRHRPGHKAEPSAAHNDTLELTWTIIPTIICVFLFYYGWHAYVKVVTPPTKAVEIQVQAKRWAWQFTHYNGVQDADLHLPVNTPVRFVMTSTDVIHSFYIPVMRIKQDIIPRRYTYAWLFATKPGTYRLNCAEYCGTNHSQMGFTGPILPDWPDGRRATVVVHDPGGYEKYLADKQADQMNMPPVDLGRMLFEKKGCNSCHTIDGTAKIGPTWKVPGGWGQPIPLADGSSVKMDENYIRESITVPSAKIHQGFTNQMPPFDTLKPSELDGLIAFIKSLKQ
jgi:cytochrome c oxidase subunit 2